MDAPRRLSESSQQAADQAGDPGLFEGAIVFVALNRTLDRPIQQALAAGGYHRATPNPCSHFFLLAERYHGPSTSVVACSLRRGNNKVTWDEDHADPTKILWHKDVKSGVCQDQTKDYDDYRAWLPDLLPSQRRDLVTDALSPVRPVPAPAVSRSLTPRNRAPPRHAQASLTAAHCPPSTSTRFSLEVPHAHP